jgi:hypothetical protein
MGALARVGAIRAIIALEGERMATKGLDSFTTFLDYMNKAEAARGGPRPSPGSSGGPSALSILAALSQAPSRTLPVGDCLRLSRLNIADCARALEAFQGGGLIELSWHAGDEWAHLTGPGACVAKIA